MFNSLAKQRVEQNGRIKYSQRATFVALREMP